MPEPPSRESPVKASALLASARNVALPWWLSLIVIVGALLLAAGAVIALLHPALLVAPGEEINGAARVYAGYLVSRNLAIAAMLLGTFILRARRALSHVMVLTAVIQILDAVIDGWEGRWMVVPGVVVLGIAFLIGAGRASGKPLWNREAWRDPR